MASRHSKYSIKASHSSTRFQFYSEGPKGRILKRVIFNPLPDFPTASELILGDVGHDDDVDVYVVSDNGDRNKVIATVGQIIMRYLSEYPNRVVVFGGTSGARTRLYQMAIAKDLENLTRDYEILGSIENEWCEFVMGNNYATFLVRKKENKLALNRYGKTSKIKQA